MTSFGHLAAASTTAPASPPSVERDGAVAADRLVADPGARSTRAWVVLCDVLDPEVPALSIVDLGIVRGVREGTTACSC